jgi:hypothetical protein
VLKPVDDVAESLLRIELVSGASPPRVQHPVENGKQPERAVRVVDRNIWPQRCAPQGGEQEPATRPLERDQESEHLTLGLRDGSGSATAECPDHLSGGTFDLAHAHLKGGMVRFAVRPVQAVPLVGLPDISHVRRIGGLLIGGLPVHAVDLEPSPVGGEVL